jgi:hypothetical protein
LHSVPEKIDWGWQRHWLVCQPLLWCCIVLTNKLSPAGGSGVSVLTSHDIVVSDLPMLFSLICPQSLLLILVVTILAFHLLQTWGKYPLLTSDLVRGYFLAGSSLLFNMKLRM